jgi:hypothetical protein
LSLQRIILNIKMIEWAAYSEALTKGKSGPWTQWKTTYGVVRKALGRTHAAMMKYEEATFYRENAGDETNAKTSVPLLLESLDKLMEACERRLNDPKADAPDALLEELNQNLPPPPAPEKPPEEPKQP